MTETLISSDGITMQQQDDGTWNVDARDPIARLRARQELLDAGMGIEHTQSPGSHDVPAGHASSEPGDPGDYAATFLRFHADYLNRVERLRIAHENRYRTLTNIWEVEGVTYGLGLPAHWPECQAIADEVERLREVENGAIRTLGHVMQRHPLHPWVEANVGVGLKIAARFIATIGDPAERPHVRLLYSYCGYGDPKAQRRRRGQQGNWNPKARSRLHVIAESCLKQIGPPKTQRRSKYRDVYDETRVKYADAVHVDPCPQCGKGEQQAQDGTIIAAKPAPVGSPLTDGHKHARGLRAMKKAMLLDLWLFARALREDT